MNGLQNAVVLLKPNEFAEQAIIRGIMDGVFPPGTDLPAERPLAEKLGVTRPTLREALHRLERDGWIHISQGKPTRVKDIWREGNLNILGGLIQYGETFSEEFIKDLLRVRLDLAPTYTALATENDPEYILDHLRSYLTLSEDPQSFASFDWQMHYRLTVASGNPIYTLILNGFEKIYLDMAVRYFSSPKARASSLNFYAKLLQAIEEGDFDKARLVTRDVMRESIELINV
jgi:GntR family negative regulator for fad regulon and positive regulator of fabA